MDCYMASGEGEPQPKKQKCSDDAVFVTFHNNCELLEVLQNALHFIEQSLFGYGFYLLKIKACDAAFPKSFVRAACACQEMRNDKHEGDCPVGYGISSIFEYGFQILEKYIASSEFLPSTKGEKLALSRLLHFLAEDLKDAETALLNAPKCITETDWTLRLAHHLLSRLTISSRYKMDVVSQGKFFDLKCSCGCARKISGNSGDTSIGVPHGWHGRIDVMMDEVPVHVSIESTESDSPVEGNFSSIEVKATGDIDASCREQIRAQAIVFSFWEQKIHPELNNFLIPNIAISREKIAFCFYDCENDVLLETPQFDLYSGNFLNISSVIVLWLALNFKFLCSGLPEEIKSTGFKADFFKVLGADVTKYEKDVTAPCDFPMEKWPLLRNIEQTRKKKRFSRKKDIE